MITAQEARDLVVLGKKKNNEEFLDNAMRKIRWAAEDGRTSTYLWHFNEQLWPSVFKLQDLGFRITHHKNDLLEVSWSNASWISRLLGG